MNMCHADIYLSLIMRREDEFFMLLSEVIKQFCVPGEPNPKKENLSCQLQMSEICHSGTSIMSLR